ncbi:hypothetical protein BJ166DRAFT_36110 [Pestalotiopsis sp. NC0098]|nr:hypothetical protein BJ166DRAFT_36110 [Pestalotiopsis sp. NC0098]
MPRLRREIQRAPHGFKHVFGIKPCVILFTTSLLPCLEFIPLGHANQLVPSVDDRCTPVLCIPHPRTTYPEPSLTQEVDTKEEMAGRY